LMVVRACYTVVVAVAARVRLEVTRQTVIREVMVEQVFSVRSAVRQRATVVAVVAVPPMPPVTAKAGSVAAMVAYMLVRRAELAATVLTVPAAAAAAAAAIRPTTTDSAMVAMVEAVSLSSGAGGKYAERQSSSAEADIEVLAPESHKHRVDVLSCDFGL